MGILLSSLCEPECSGELKRDTLGDINATFLLVMGSLYMQANGNRSRINSV